MGSTPNSWLQVYLDADIMESQSSYFLPERSYQYPTTPHNASTTHPQFSQSTYAPTDAEASLLKDMLQKDTEVLHQYDEIIAAFEERLGTLRKASSILQDNIALYKSARSACRRVPSEIWQLIFTFLCHQDSLKVSWGGNPGRVMYQTQTTTLSQVCRSWRAATRGLPSLWSSINVDLDLVDRDFRGPLGLHLENSKHSLLHIRLAKRAEYRTYTQPSCRNHGADLWALVALHIHRCQVLELVGDGYEALTKVSNVSLSQLRRLSLGASRSRRIDEHSWLWHALQNAPLLDSARVMRFNELMVLPCSQLTTIQISTLYSSGCRTELLLDLLQHLGRCTNLCDLNVRGDFNNYNGRTLPINQGPQFPVTLTRLRRLIIYDSTTHEGKKVQSRFYSSLILPSLVELDLECRSSGAETFLPIILRSSPPLETVSLRFQAMPSLNAMKYPILECLGSPVLRRLAIFIRLKDPGTDWKKPEDAANPFLKSLLDKLETVPLGSEPGIALFPGLKGITLAIDGVVLDAQVLANVAEMLKKRMTSSFPLRKFELIRYTPHSEVMGLEPDALETIGALGQRYGVDATVREQVVVHPSDIYHSD